MKNELELLLGKKYPFMRRDEPIEADASPDLQLMFGCECGDGWYGILNSLCGELTAAYEANGWPVDVVVDQVKEKYGELRFYYHHTNQELPPVLRQQIRSIVEKWENESTTVCDECGAPGMLRTRHGWLRTLCDTCYSEERR